MHSLQKVKRFLFQESNTSGFPIPSAEFMVCFLGWPTNGYLQQNIHGLKTASVWCSNVIICVMQPLQNSSQQNNVFSFSTQWSRTPFFFLFLILEGLVTGTLNALISQNVGFLHMTLTLSDGANTALYCNLQY